MFRTLLFVICAVRAEFWDTDVTTRNSLKVWLENLKRRLMTDNYDYEPSSNEVEMRAQDNNPLDAPMYTTTDTTANTPTDDLLDAQQDKIYQQIQFAYDSAEKQNDKAGADDELATVHTLYMPHHLPDNDGEYSPSVPQNSIEERDDYHGISRNDLKINVKDWKIQVPDPVLPKNVSYKIIQPSLLSRRAGGAVPRFIEEVGANGVSLLSVDGAPFPEFQLPAARRQYQAVRDSLSEDWLD